MKKTISLILLSLLITMTGCDVIQDELGIDLGLDKDKDKDDTPQINVNVKKTPCAFFTFDGSYDDLSGNDNYAYGNPEPTFTAGPQEGKKALSFSRANGSSVIVNDGLIDTPSMTISFWIKDPDEGDIFWVTSLNEWNGHHRMMYLSFVRGHLRYVMERYHCAYWSSENIGHFTHNPIDDGDWHHIALVSDHNVLKKDHVSTSLYVDGILMDSVTEQYFASKEKEESECHFNTGTKFMIGGTNTPNMKIANLRVYDEWQLPAEEIKKLYEKCL